MEEDRCQLQEGWNESSSQGVGRIEAECILAKGEMTALGSILSQSQFVTVWTYWPANNLIYQYLKKCRDCIHVNPARKNKMQEDTLYKDKRLAKYSCPYLVEWYLDKQDNIFLWSSMVLHKTMVGKQSQCIQVCDQFHNNRRYTHLFATALPLCNTFLSLCRNICWLTSQLNEK